MLSCVCSAGSAISLSRAARWSTRPARATSSRLARWSGSTARALSTAECAAAHPSRRGSTDGTKIALDIRDQRSTSGRGISAARR